MTKKIKKIIVHSENGTTFERNGSQRTYKRSSNRRIWNVIDNLSRSQQPMEHWIGDDENEQQIIELDFT